MDSFKVGRGEKVKCIITNYHCSTIDHAYIYKIRFDSLCGMDGRESLPATIRQGHAKAYQMVC